MVFCCQSQSTFEQIYIIYQDAGSVDLVILLYSRIIVKSQCSEAWAKLCRRDGLEYLKEFVRLWRNFTKYVDTLYSFFRCLEKKIANSNLKSEARSTFHKDVFLRGYEHAKDCAIVISDSQVTIINLKYSHNLNHYFLEITTRIIINLKRSQLEPG